MNIRSLTPLLQVFDMPSSVRFYRDVLGFEVVSKSHDTVDGSDWIMLKLADSTLMLNTAYERDVRPPSPDRTRIAAHLDTALFFGCDSADAVYSHLRGKGWPANEPATQGYGMRQVCTKDPDGYQLCFQHAADTAT